MFKLTKKKVAAGAVAAGLLAMTGVGYAYWTTSGSGEGSASTTAGVSDELSFDQTSLDPMFPGDEAQNFTVTVTNDSGESAYVTTVKAYITTDKGDDCTGADFLLNGAPAPSTEATAAALDWTGIDIAAGDNAATSGDDTIQFNNTASNQDGCKNADVTIHYVAA